MTAIPRYRPHQGPALLSAGFRPFFLLVGCAATVGIPLWLLAFAGIAQMPSAFPPLVWHGHEMVFGFGLATVAVFGSAWTGEAVAAPLDLAFPAALVAVMGREILAGRNLAQPADPRRAQRTAGRRCLGAPRRARDRFAPAGRQPGGRGGAAADQHDGRAVDL